MRYLKRLKNELQELTEKIIPSKGALPTYVSVKKLNRKEIIPLVISLIYQARELDHATDGWSSETAQAWTSYLIDLKHWLGQAPSPPKSVEKSKAAA